MTWIFVLIVFTLWVGWKIYGDDDDNDFPSPPASPNLKGTW